MTTADRQRKIAALRALAERPGTPAEGETARAMLAKMEAQQLEDPPVGLHPREFIISFEALLFQQAMRDAREAMFKMAEEQENSREGFRPRWWSACQGPNGPYWQEMSQQEDWHSQQRREADERQRRDVEESRKRATAASANGQFHTSFADAVDETHRTGETLAEVFQRKKEEWLLSQRLEAWARSQKK